mmetsp:Transcript_86953/g.246539  ORF Transcript_86953/g.246539 Transcript_86953/m.246539 type:complete len:399 (+) Transcript_86953:60-1256(+)
MRTSCALALAGALSALLGARGTGTSHQFGMRHARVHVHGASSGRRLFARERVFSVLHVSDAHISLKDDDPPLTTRMYKAFEGTTDRVTGLPSSSSAEFVRLMEMACKKSVDLIALGGDIVNYPSNTTVGWVLETMRGAGCGIPYIFTAGNHDWHLEGLASDRRYDSQREHELGTTLLPLLANSAAPQSRLYGHVNMKGVDVLSFDNSNHQITEDQLAFARKHLGEAGSSHVAPVLLLLHMPLNMPGVDLPPKLSCGHPEWGAATDENWQLEGRPRWPEEGNLPSTVAFIELVRTHAAPAGRIVALLTGHVHRDFSVPAAEDRGPAAANRTALACDARRAGCALRPGTSLFEVGAAVGDLQDLLEADGAVQYTTLDGAEGGYRLVTVHQGTVRGTSSES